MDAALQAVLWEQLGAMLSEPETSKSQSIAPINRLPSEILAMIFTLASNRCIIHDETDSGSQLVMPTIFSSVCGLWRQISLSTCSLWSHLDISMKNFEYGVPCHRWELWESRSRPGPLSVHISDEGFTWGREAAEAMVTEIVSFLTPHMTRVSEIHAMSCKSKFPNYMLDVLALWAREGAAKPARLLKIGDHKSAFGDINLRGRLSHTAQPVTTDNFEAFFQSLHTLHLHRAFIPWDSSVYHGLVDLYLTAGAHSPQQWFPTQSQLARVLAACPKLRSLRLTDFTVRLDRDFIPSPIILDHLEVLSLLQPNSFDYKIMKRVLPLIGSSSSSFEVSLKLNMETDFTAITRSFFSRCNLTRLHLSTQNLPVQCILPLLAGHVSRLHSCLICVPGLCPAWFDCMFV
ncbi:hypothetical protein FRC12_007172 [Ceratobasidium sp. 428]|nr:hypothetical protein FRC12_007172 [Ceratobasidium sp. 428]